MPLASDADTVGRIARCGEFDLLPALRPEEARVQVSSKTTLETITYPSDISQMSDEKLMGMVCAENADALNELFSRHSRLVYGIALRILRDQITKSINDKISADQDAQKMAFVIWSLMDFV